MPRPVAPKMSFNVEIAGENVILFGEAFDPDDNSITYTWTSESLFFANEENFSIFDHSSGCFIQSKVFFTDI